MASWHSITAWKCFVGRIQLPPTCTRSTDRAFFPDGLGVGDGASIFLTRRHMTMLCWMHKIKSHGSSRWLQANLKMSGRQVNTNYCGMSMGLERKGTLRYSEFDRIWKEKISALNPLIFFAKEESQNACLRTNISKENRAVLVDYLLGKAEIKTDKNELEMRIATPPPLLYEWVIKNCWPKGWAFGIKSNLGEIGLRLSELWNRGWKNGNMLEGKLISLSCPKVMRNWHRKLRWGRSLTAGRSVIYPPRPKNEKIRAFE